MLQFLGFAFLFCLAVVILLSIMFWHQDGQRTLKYKEDEPNLTGIIKVAAQIHAAWDKVESQRSAARENDPLKWDRENLYRIARGCALIAWSLRQLRARYAGNGMLAQELDRQSRLVILVPWAVFAKDDPTLGYMGRNLLEIVDTAVAKIKVFMPKENKDSLEALRAMTEGDFT